MTGFVTRNLSAHEKLLYKTGVHWVFFARPVAILILGYVLLLQHVIQSFIGFHQAYMGFLEKLMHIPHLGVALATVLPPEMMNVQSVSVFMGSLIILAGLGIFTFGFCHLIWTLFVFCGAEMVITNRRVIAKFGIIRRDVSEISLERVEGVDVIQGFLGRFLGYGSVVVRGVGHEVFMPMIVRPLLFRQRLDALLDNAAERRDAVGQAVVK